MTVNELVEELIKIRERMGGSLPVCAIIKTKKSRSYSCDGCGSYGEETVTEDASVEVDSVSDEMMPPARGDGKRKAVLR